MLRKSVRVGGNVYEIQGAEPPLVLDKLVCRGTVDHEACEIKYDNSRALCRTKETLWHEALHAMLRQRRICVENEEEVVNELAAALNALMADNGVEFWEV